MINENEEGYLFYSDRGNLFLLVINNLPLDFAEKLPLSGFDKIEVKEIGINDFKIECFKKTGKSYKLVKLFKFKFLGFEALKSGSFVSINLRSFLPLSGSKVKIKSAEIASYLGAKNGGEMKFYFSVDGGKKWIEAPPGKKVVFKTSFQKNDLRWKVDLISSEKDKVITKKSPFLSQVKIVYEVE